MEAHEMYSLKRKTSFCRTPRLLVKRLILAPAFQSFVKISSSYKTSLIAKVHFLAVTITHTQNVFSGDC